jgi:N-acetylmuramoyl-L-alanine amidase
MLVAAGCGSGERPSFVDDGDGVQTTTFITRPDDDPSGDADGRTSGSASDAGPVGTDPVDGVAVDAYPPVTDDTVPPPSDLRALLTPAGVLVTVTAELDGGAGYVVGTPCGGETTVAWGQPMGPVQVVLDPGHGGSEPGATDIPGLSEAQLNLRVARRTATELTRRGITVALTRNGDHRIPIRRRADLADALAPAAFVSIHHNTPASRPSPVPGTEVYVQSTSTDSRRLGGVLYESVVEALSQFDIEWTARDDAGVLTVLNDEGGDAYGINRYPATPSALVELAYMGNEKEAALLVTEEYERVAARAVADGIEDYLTTDAPGTGYVETPRPFTPAGGTGGTTGCVDPPLE